MTKAAPALIFLLLATEVAAQEKQTTTREVGMGCRSTDDTRAFYKFIGQDDKLAAAKFAQQNGCRWFTAGETVWIVDPAPLSGMNGVRPKGESRTFYVPKGVAS